MNSHVETDIQLAKDGKNKFILKKSLVLRNLDLRGSHIFQKNNAEERERMPAGIDGEMVHSFRAAVG